MYTKTMYTLNQNQRNAWHFQNNLHTPSNHRANCHNYWVSGACRLRRSALPQKINP